MKGDNLARSAKLLSKISDQYDSMRCFCKAISEWPSDVSRWCSGKKIITPRAVIEVCRLHPEISPYELNSEIFPEDLVLTFKRSKK